MTLLTEPVGQRVLCPRVRVDCHDRRPVSAEWQVARTPADSHPDPRMLDDLTWVPVRVPGTAAGALRDAGLWAPGEPYDFDGEDWWFRASFDMEPVDSHEEVLLRLEGIATVSEVYLNGERVLESDSMFAAHAPDVGERIRDGNEIAIRCCALAPLLAESRRPRARWRTRVVAERNLRFFRTMLLGRAPGFAPGPAAVGPWRPVQVERRRRVAIEELTLRPRVEGERGSLSVQLRLRPLDGARPSSVEVELDGPSGVHRFRLELNGPADALTAKGQLSVPRVERWWPHTHGEPVLYDVRLLIESASGQTVVEAGRIGFRELAFGVGSSHDVEKDGLDLHVNGVGVFVRGAVWTPIDPVGLAPPESHLRAELACARDAGMNMLRLPGTGAYETSTFHDICDELGILVWQDFMFANFDYPQHEPFRATVWREATEVLAAVGGRPSLAVICGNSEVEQQVAMLGLDPSLGRGELFGDLLPELVRASGVDAVYVPSAPCGGELPFRPDRGIANYYGVGGYRRPLTDVRRAGVLFAAECLAFSNVPSDAQAGEMHVDVNATPVGGARGSWTGIPRDVGADWDFGDVRDYYLGALFGVDPHALRRADGARYLELSRAVTGEVMAEVFGEWRRAASPCRGGLVLWLRDIMPGAGWGLIDYSGVPKIAYHHLKRTLAPVAVWTVDEGLGGVVVHVANDAREPLRASLRVALYRDYELCIEHAAIPVELAPHSQAAWNVEAIIGRFVDASWAYRFGPPAQDAIVASLERRGDSDIDPEILSQAVHFPAGRPLERESPGHLGLEAETVLSPNGEIELVLKSRRLAYGVCIDVPRFLPSDNGFFIEPGHKRGVMLAPTAESTAESGKVGALNMRGTIPLGALAPAL